MTLLNPRNLLYNQLLTLQSELENFADELGKVIQNQESPTEVLIAKLSKINQKLQLDEVTKVIDNLHTATDENRHLYIKSLLGITYGIITIINAEVYNRGEETPPDFYK